MARERKRGSAPRKPRGKPFREEYSAPPTGDEAGARWREFMQKLDQLNERVAQLDERVCTLIDMGETVHQALEEAAERTRNPLLDIFQRVGAAFAEARRHSEGQQR